MKLRKPIASLASVVLLSIGMATMATSTASASTTNWPNHWNDWSRSTHQNNGGDGGGDNQHVTTQSDTSYVVVAWRMPSWAGEHAPTWPQSLATSKAVLTKDLSALDSWANTQNGCFQIDGYNANATTTKLLGGGHLDGPNNPAESLWGGADWKLVKVGTGCTPPPPVNNTVTPVAPTVAPATCHVGEGGVADVTGGSIAFPTTAGVSYSVTGGKTMGLEGGSYIVTATPATGKSLSVAGTGWALNGNGTASISVNVAAAPDCSIPKPDAKVTTTEWVDGTWGCDATTVQQTRTVTTTPYTWDNGWVLESATTVTETRTRNLSSAEETVCPAGTLPIPAAPTITSPTCAVDGSATLANGAHFTWGQTSFGPGSWTATATAASGYTFDKSHTTTYAVTFTVAPKLTGTVCPVSEVESAPPNSSVTPAPFSEVLAAAPNASAGSVLASTGATPLPLAIIALVLLGAGAMLQPRVRRAIFTRH